MTDFSERIKAQSQTLQEFSNTLESILDLIKRTREAAKELGLEKEFCHEIVRAAKRDDTRWIEFVYAGKAKPMPYYLDDEAGTND